MVLNARIIGAPAPALSARQREVLSLICEGRQNSEIAKAMGLCLDTVKTRVQEVLFRLGAFNRHHAVGIAMRCDLLTANPRPREDLLLVTWSPEPVHPARIPEHVRIADYGAERWGVLHRSSHLSRNGTWDRRGTTAHRNPEWLEDHTYSQQAAIHHARIIAVRLRVSQKEP